MMNLSTIQTELSMGGPSHEVIMLALALRGQTKPARILDLGCGDGRNAFMLAGEGYHVTAVDSSRDSLSVLEEFVRQYPRNIYCIHSDVLSFSITEIYHAILAHGLLHFLNKEQIDTLVADIKKATAPGGINIFTTAFSDNRSQVPEDFIDQGHQNAIAPGALLTYYNDWDLVLHERYHKWDFHPDVGNHSHPIEKYVFRKPGAEPLKLESRKMKLNDVGSREFIDRLHNKVIGRPVGELIETNGIPDMSLEYFAAGPQYSFLHFSRNGYKLNLLFFGHVMVYSANDVIAGYSIFESDFSLLNVTDI